MRLPKVLVIALFFGLQFGFPLVAGAQPAPSTASSKQHEKLDIMALRRKAAAKHQILEVIYYPDVDSVQNWSLAA
jgi:hypothetical protein